MKLPESIRRQWAEGSLPRRLALAAWAMVLVGVCVYTLLWTQNHNVYLIFATAGRHWLAGESLYGSVEPGLDVFRYSPLAAALFAPLSLFVDGPAGALWRLLNAAFYIGGLWWWLGELHPGRLTPSQKAGFFLLLLPLSLPNLINGQVNPLMIGLLFASIAAVRRGRFTLAGVAAGLAFWLKLYPVAVGLLLVLLYRGRFTRPFLAALAAGFVLPFFLQGPAYVSGQYQEWVTYLVSEHRELGPVKSWFKDARLLLHLSGVTLGDRGYLLLEMVTGLGAAALCWWRQRRGDSPRGVLLLMTYLGCGWMTLFGPATETAAWIVIAPAVATALVLAWGRREMRFDTAVLLGCYVLLAVAHPVKRYLWDSWQGFLAIQPLAGAIFLGWVIVATLRGHFAAVGEENATTSTAAGNETAGPLAA